jgi:uncharacterized membrane protein
VEDDDRSTTQEAAKSAVDRLTFFSDAVVAIAMTLLAIDLPVPTADSATTWLNEVDDYLGEYLAFVLSFLVILRYWRTHHRVFRYLVDTPQRLITVNSCWLFAVILTPYATRVLFAGEGTDDSDFPFRFAFYAIVQAAAGLSVYWCGRVIAAHGVLSHTAPPGLLKRSQIANLTVALTFLASVPVSFLVGAWAFVIWWSLGVVTNAAMSMHERRHPEQYAR